MIPVGAVLFDEGDQHGCIIGGERLDGERLEQPRGEIFVCEFPR